MPHLVEVTTLVAAPPDVPFRLSLDVDVHAASLARTGETAVSSSGRPVLGLGDEVHLRARHLGVRWRMTSRVTALDAPRRFVDEQVRGPFAALHHEHLFTDLGDGTTEVLDRMLVTAPGARLLPPLARWVERRVLGPHLHRVLRERAAHLAALAARQSASGSSGAS